MRKIKTLILFLLLSLLFNISWAGGHYKYYEVMLEEEYRDFDNCVLILSFAIASIREKNPQYKHNEITYDEDKQKFLYQIIEGKGGFFYLSCEGSKGKTWLEEI